MSVRLIIAFFTMLLSLPALALDKVTFATNWRAQAEHGGFYQAVADGTYARYGLDVTIQQGGPQVNARLLLAAGRVDFAMGANTIQMFESVQQNVPLVTVASMFQIEPAIFMSHPGEGFDRFEDLPKATVFIASDFRASVWQWLKQTYGFKDANAKPYGFNAAPFLADKKSAQEGILTSEPYAIETKGGFRPNVFLLADYGYDSYSTTIETRAETIEKKPDLVQRFVDASIIGWRNYVYGDNAAANAAIKRDNPEMTDGQIAFFDLEVDGARRRRFRRLAHARHWRHDRCAHEKLLRQDGEGGRGSGGPSITGRATLCASSARKWAWSRIGDEVRLCEQS